MTEEDKQRLAERCAASGKTPFYISKVNYLGDMRGNSIPLSEIKQGLYYMSVSVQPMENTATTYIRPESKERAILVTDAITMDGMVFFETLGSEAYSTIPFQKEWSHILSNEKAIQTTKLIDKSIEEFNRWFKGDSWKLAEQFELTGKITSTHDKKGTLNVMVGAISDYLEKNKPQRPYNEQTIDEIKLVAHKAVKEYAKLIQMEIDVAVSQKLIATGLPILYCERPFSFNYTDYDKFIKDTETLHNFSGQLNVRPIMSNRAPSCEYFENMTLRDILTIDAKKYYITDRAIFTKTDLGDAFREALRREGILTPEIERCDVMQYLSWMQTNSPQVLNVPSIFDKEDHLSKEQQENLFREPIEFRERFDLIAENAYRADITPRLLPHQPQIENSTQFRMIDANGVLHNVSEQGLMPGMKVIIEEGGNSVEIKELMRTRSGNLVFTTDRELYTNDPELVKHCQHVAQQLEAKRELTDQSGNDDYIRA